MGILWMGGRGPWRLVSRLGLMGLGGEEVGCWSCALDARVRRTDLDVFGAGAFSRMCHVLWPCLI